MPLDIKNVHYREQPYMRAQDFFQLANLDMKVLSSAIVNQSDVFAHDSDYVHPALKTQWVMWQLGYLAELTKRRVALSCVV